MKDVYFIYHYSEETRKITCLYKIRFEHGFVTRSYLRSMLFDCSEEYFLNAENEDPENEIYMLNEYGDKLGSFKKKFFSPEADNEPFDNDKETDVDFNGDWN